MVEELSTVFTLEPGDVVSTGTPAGVALARTLSGGSPMATWYGWRSKGWERWRTRSLRRPHLPVDARIAVKGIVKGIRTDFHGRMEPMSPHETASPTENSVREPNSSDASDAASSPASGQKVALSDEERADRLREVQALVELMRPAVQADGGDLVLTSVDVEAGVIEVQLQGACSSCAISSATLQGGVERIVEGPDQLGDRSSRRGGRIRRLLRERGDGPRGLRTPVRLSSAS